MPRVASRVGPGAAKRPVSVLFVLEESSQECADYVAAVLRKGWHADVTSSAEMALARISADPPDVLVTEADLGGEFDGFALAHRVKADPATRHLPMIVLAAVPFGDGETARSASRCGACVSSPRDADAVIVAVSSALAIAEILARRRALRDAGGDSKGGTLVRSSPKRTRAGGSVMREVAHPALDGDPDEH